MPKEKRILEIGPGQNPSRKATLFLDKYDSWHHKKIKTCGKSLIKGVYRRYVHV